VTKNGEMNIVALIPWDRVIHTKPTVIQLVYEIPPSADGPTKFINMIKNSVNPVFLHDIVNFAKCACSDILGKKLITIISYTTE